MTDWRSIPLGDLAYPAKTNWPAVRALQEVYATLGEVADADAQAVRRIGRVGGGTITIMVDLIRRAEAGEDVRRQATGRTLLDMARSKGRRA